MEEAERHDDLSVMYPGLSPGTEKNKKTKSHLEKGESRAALFGVVTGDINIDYVYATFSKTISSGFVFQHE